MWTSFLGAVWTLKSTFKNTGLFYLLAPKALIGAGGADLRLLGENVNQLEHLAKKVPGTDYVRKQQVKTFNLLSNGPFPAWTDEKNSYPLPPNVGSSEDKAFARHVADTWTSILITAIRMTLSIFDSSSFPGHMEEAVVKAKGRLKKALGVLRRPSSKCSIPIVFYEVGERLHEHEDSN